MSEDGNFLKDFVRLSEGTEIPPQFAIWCGIAGVSAALGRRTWVDMGIFTVYPNVFVILIAGSGKCRKSTSINQIERMLRTVDPPPNIVAQSLTPQALIQSLKLTQVDDATATVRETCEGFVVADELATFLNRHSYDAGLGSLMIPLYDCKDKYDYRTISRGTEQINNACLGMLAGTTIESIRKCLPEQAIGEGLTSRMLFIYVDTPMPPVPRPILSKEKRDIMEKNIRQLERISEMRGPFSTTTKADELFDDEYIRFHHESEFYEKQITSGYASRRSVQVYKLSMILSASEGTSYLIEEHHVKGAISLLEQIEPQMNRVLSLIVSTPTGEGQETILTIIDKAGSSGASRQTIMREMSSKMNYKEINDLIDTLKNSGKINLIYTPGAGGGVIYKRTS
jgi:hypothetical protein